MIQVIGRTKQDLDGEGDWDWGMTSDLIMVYVSVGCDWVEGMNSLESGSEDEDQINLEHTMREVHLCHTDDLPSSFVIGIETDLVVSRID